jgi:type IV secretory pathway VirB2 component (pilin)
LDVPTDGDVRTSIEDVINAALNYVTLIGVVVIIIAGFVLMFGAGSDESIQKAKKIIIYTLIGIFVIYFSRVIVGLITNVATDSSTSINN